LEAKKRESWEVRRLKGLKPESLGGQEAWRLENNDARRLWYPKTLFFLFLPNSFIESPKLLS